MLSIERKLPLRLRFEGPESLLSFEYHLKSPKHHACFTKSKSFPPENDFKEGPFCGQEIPEYCRDKIETYLEWLINC